MELKLLFFTERNNGYNLLRHNVYIHSTCTLKLGSQVVDNSIIGENTRVGEGCQITNSIIGAGVTIGNNCVIESKDFNFELVDSWTCHRIFSNSIL